MNTITQLTVKVTAPVIVAAVAVTVLAAAVIHAVTTGDITPVFEAGRKAP